MQWDKTYSYLIYQARRAIHSVSTKIVLVSLISLIAIISLLLVTISLVLVNIDNNFFSIVLPNQNIEAIENIISVVFWTIIVLLTSCYFVIYKLLTPLKKIHKGVDAISQGNLHFQFQSKRKDEFGDIMRSFDRMTKNITDLLKEKRQLLLNLSHELKTPLTRSKLSLENITSSKYKQNIREDILEIENMIDSILEAEELSEQNLQIKVEKIPFQKTIKEIVNHHQRKNISINYQNKSTKKFFFFHKNHLKILINNLIQNAVKYSSSTIFVKSKTIENHFILEVQDFGIGISEAELPKITNAFYRVDKSRSKKSGGYGLGLSICQKIVDLHRGILEIKSELNKGTTVRIILPLKNE